MGMPVRNPIMEKRYVPEVAAASGAIAAIQATAQCVCPIVYIAKRMVRSDVPDVSRRFVQIINGLAARNATVIRSAKMTTVLHAEQGNMCIRISAKQTMQRIVVSMGMVVC